MTKKREGDGLGDDVPAVLEPDATERHLVKARELLREARSRLSSHDDGEVDSEPHPQAEQQSGEGADE